MTELSQNSVPKTAHRLFLFATIFTWPLLFVGGLVTTYRVGMAVPDWPTTFGINMFLYNFLNSAWGVFIEHGHRLYGSAVGLCLLIVAPWVQSLRNVPVRFKKAAWLALAGVIFQGIMGGLRVTQISTQLAMFHGCFAQLFFAYLACLTAWSAPSWNRISLNSDLLPTHRTVTLSQATAVMIYVQIIAGAWLRHFQSVDKLYIHSLLGLCVAVLVTVLSVRVRKDGLAQDASIRRVKTRLVALTHSQWLLGVFAWLLMRPFDGIAKPVTDIQAVVRTLHQANGALILAHAVVLALWMTLRSHALRDSHHATSPSVEAVCLP